MKNYNRNKLKDYINRIVIWLYDKHNIDVVFVADGDNSYCYDGKIIEVNNKTNLRVQLCTLLHEIGHAMLSNDRKKYIKQFPRGNLNYDQANKKTRGYKIDILREEILAWEEALKIAKELNVILDKKWFNKYRRECIWSYVCWMRSLKGESWTL